MPLKKLRNSWRSTRQTRSRSKRQKEAILEGAMTSQSTDGQPGASELFIFLNDFTDSDNEATAELWAWVLKKLGPRVKGIYIAEPRWVNLGYYMTSKDFGRCIGLVSKLQPPLEGGDPALTTVLAGRLTEEMIKSRQVDGRPLNDDERDLVSNTLSGARSVCHILFKKVSNNPASLCDVSSQRMGAGKTPSNTHSLSHWTI